MNAIKCSFPFGIVGRGVEVDESLLRIMTHPLELKALLEGGLSMTQARSFSDQLEAKQTQGDDLWISAFYGDQANSRREWFENRRQDELATAYVSCWHRLSASSDLTRLTNEYKSKDSNFQCAVRTSVQSLSGAFFPPDGTPLFMEFFAVRYLEDEATSLRDLLDDEPPRSLYPALEFKRNALYGHEQEARFVMSTFEASLVSPGSASLVRAVRDRWQYAAIDPRHFIEHLYPLNCETKVVVDSLLTGLDYSPGITQCAAKDLKDFAFSQQFRMLGT
jgi:hypothetical protein